MSSSLQMQRYYASSLQMQRYYILGPEILCPQCFYSTPGILCIRSSTQEILCPWYSTTEIQTPLAVIDDCEMNLSPLPVYLLKYSILTDM